MKYSGIEWIGNIPDKWKLERLQWHLDEIKESNDPIQTKQVLSLTNKLGVIPYEEKGEQGNKSKENFDEYKLAYPNTIVANSMNILIGSVGKCNYFGCVSPVYYVFKPKENNDIDFLNYLFQTSEFQKELRKYANGILEIRLRVSSSDILKREIPLPSFSIQQQIVSYLNRKCSEIDALIENENKQIEKLKEYKQALIDKIALNGIGNKEYKKVKLDWIDSIPNNWSIIPLKYKFSIGKGLPITKDDLVEDGIKVISYGQIHGKYNISTSIVDDMYRYVPSKYLDTNVECLVKKDDFIFADTSEDVDGSGDFIYIDSEDKIFAGYHCLKLSSLDLNNNKYLSYLFSSKKWKKQIQSQVTGVKLFSISRGMIKDASLILPASDEQKLICDFLDEKCLSIYKVINIKKEKIEKLQEYKKSLIYEYVTGKKEVSLNA